MSDTKQNYFEGRRVVRPDLDYVRWEGEDSVFEGHVVSRYQKLSGKRMVVVEDDRGLNHIYPADSEKLVILVPAR